MQLSLKELKPGESCTVLKVGGERAIRRRLFDMGITPGADIYVRKLAPMGDPMELTVRGYELSLRNTEAEVITVDKK